MDYQVLVPGIGITGIALILAWRQPYQPKNEGQRSIQLSNGQYEGKSSKTNLLHIYYIFIGPGKSAILENIGLVLSDNHEIGYSEV